MTKLRAYSVGDQVVFRYEKATRTGKIKEILPSLDRLGRITTRVTITATYADMGGNAHAVDIPGVRYNAIVGLQEQESEVHP